jgi:hypothetical protein
MRESMRAGELRSKTLEAPEERRSGWEGEEEVVWMVKFARWASWVA